MAKGGNFPGLRKDFAAPEAFVPQLEYAGAPFEDCGGCLDRVQAEALQRGSVDDRVDAGEWLVQQVEL
jgi:hypothetical protein